MPHPYRPGDPILIEHEVYATRPVKDAVSVRPAPRGETYQCTVRERAVVVEADPLGLLLVETESGQRLQLAATDSRLRRPSLLARWLSRVEHLVTIGRA